MQGCGRKNACHNSHDCTLVAVVAVPDTMAVVFMAIVVVVPLLVYVTAGMGGGRGRLSRVSIVQHIPKQPCC